VPEARRGAVRIGCSGWNYAHWRERFYPKGLPSRRWLHHYAAYFDTVEVNTTFYRLPNERFVESWVLESPPGFVFAVKASRYLTHMKRLTELGPGLERFYERLRPLARSPKLGPVLWQLPPTFHRDDARLAAALAALPAGRHCFEFRHPSWFAPETYELLRRHGAALVIGDRPEVQAFQALELTADFTFVRFHHGGGDGNYSHDQLEVWARRLEEWRERVDCYCYFNNDWEAFAVENGLWLRERLGV